MNNNKGMSASIYENKGHGNCSNGGISSYCKDVTIVNSKCKVFEADEQSPAVVIVKRIIGGKEYLHAEPVEKPTGIGWMAGGTFIYTCDSRFREEFGNYPISLHDREESQKEYDILST